MATSADIIATTGVDVRGFQRGMQTLERGTKKAGSLFKNLGFQAGEAFASIGAGIGAGGFAGIFSGGNVAVAALTAITAATYAWSESSKEAFKNVSKTVNTSVDGYDGILGKLKEINKLSVEEKNKTVHNFIHGEKASYIQNQLQKERLNLANKYGNAVDSEIDASKQSSVAVKQRVELANLELETREKIAALTEAVRDEEGKTSKEGVRILDAGVALIEHRAELRRQELELSIKQEEAEVELNKQEAVRGETLDDQLDRERDIQSALQGQIELARRFYGENSKIVSALQVQRKESERRYEILLRNYEAELRSAKNSLEVQKAKLTGDKEATTAAQTRLNYENQIVQALREGKKELAATLAQQAAMEILEGKVDQELAGPEGRRAQRDEERARNRAINKVVNRERVRAQNRARGAYGQRDAMNVSNAQTQKNLAAIQKGAAQQVQTINAGTIVVTQLKPK